MEVELAQQPHGVGSLGILLHHQCGEGQVAVEQAEQRLRESPRVAEVAEGLGFSDESAFAKAFRRWSGITPGQFRQGLGQ